MEGLGDLIKAGTEAVGIEQKKDCGCKKRQKKLNKLFPFKAKVRRQYSRPIPPPRKDV